jgi:hypothetical protein
MRFRKDDVHNEADASGLQGRATRQLTTGERVCQVPRREKSAALKAVKEAWYYSTCACRTVSPFQIYLTAIAAIRQPSAWQFVQKTSPGVGVMKSERTRRR